MRTFAAVLLCAAVAAFGWALPWPDPAQAGAALQWVAFGGLALVIYTRETDVRVRLACATAFGVAAAGAGCASMWDLVSQVKGSCDEGTGRPITAGIALVVMAVAGELLRVGLDGGKREKR